jgi:hypothetical protein
MGWQWAIGLKGISGKLGNSGTGTGNPNYPNTNRVLGLTIRISNRVIRVRVIRVRVRVVRIWVMGNGFFAQAYTTSRHEGAEMVAAFGWKKTKTKRLFKMIFFNILNLNVQKNYQIFSLIEQNKVTIFLEIGT